MSGIAELFSLIDSFKRKGKDVLANPLASMEQHMGLASDKARDHRELLSKTVEEDRVALKAGKPMGKGPANEALMTRLMEAYNPAGAGMIVGYGAGINRKMLAEAARAEMKGGKPAQIWEDTGWARAPDNNWKTELDDSKMNLKWHQPMPSSSHGIRAPSQIEHPELLKAYPELGKLNYDVRVDPRYTQNEGGMSLSHGSRMPLSIEGTSPTFNEGRKTLLHELQHGVQTYEGWQNGGNPNMFKGGTPDSRYQRYRRLAGEAEARLTESRANLTQDDRRWAKNFPFDPRMFSAVTGVSPERLIYP